jgi:hypothetical protein
MDSFSYILFDEINLIDEGSHILLKMNKTGQSLNPNEFGHQLQLFEPITSLDNRFIYHSGLLIRWAWCGVAKAGHKKFHIQEIELWTCDGFLLTRLTLLSILRSKTKPCNFGQWRFGQCPIGILSNILRWTSPAAQKLKGRTRVVWIGLLFREKEIWF